MLKPKCVYLLSLLGGLLISPSFAGIGAYKPATNTTVAKSGVSAKLSQAEMLGKLPLSFEANQGQTDARVKFFARRGRLSIFLTPEDAVFSLRPQSADSKATKAIPNAFQMKLVGANSTATVDGLEELPLKTNYYIGDDPKKWHSNIPSFAEVRYKGVYPGVDLLFHGNERDLEYDFVLAPGSDPNVIKLDFAGAKGLKIDRDGNLVLKLSGEDFRFRKPVVYQPALIGAKERELLDGKFVIRRHHEVSFQVGKFDRTRELVIDPTSLVVNYFTYFGGANDDGIQAITVDANKNAYIAGSSNSPTFPSVPSGVPGFAPINPDNGSNQNDACIANGTPCLVSFVAALTSPTSSAPQQTALFFTYLGGSSSDVLLSNVFQSPTATGIALDKTGNVYVTGTPGAAPDFPIFGQNSLPPYQTTLGGAYLTELSSTGALLYSTFLGVTGGASRETPSNTTLTNGIEVNSTSKIILVGSTPSSSFTASASAFQSSCGNPVSCGFVAEFDPSAITQGQAAQLPYFSYLGGSTTVGALGDAATAVTLDSSDKLYITGDTSSTDFPTTANAYQLQLGSANGAAACVPGSTTACAPDAFVTKVDLMQSGASQLQYSTYLGGDQEDVPTAITIDKNLNVYVTGTTTSLQMGENSFPTLNYYAGGLTDSNESAVGPGNMFTQAFAAFVSELNPAGSALYYSTFLNSAHGNSIAVDSTGDTFVAGEGPIPLVDDLGFLSISNANFTFLRLVPFLLEFTPAGTNGNAPIGFQFSTLLCGYDLSGNGGCTASANAVDLDADGTAYVAGNDSAQGAFPRNPTGISVIQPNYASGFWDGFLISIANTIHSGAVFTGCAPNVSPCTLQFSNAQPLGQTQVLILTVTNNGQAGLNFTSSPNGGPSIIVDPQAGNAADFCFPGDSSCTAPPGTTCPLSNTGTVLPNNSCNIAFSFTPSNTAPQGTSVFVYDNAPGAPQSVALTGTGTGGSASLTVLGTTQTVTTINFPGLQAIQVPAPAQNFLLTNTSASIPLTVNYIATGVIPNSGNGNGSLWDFTLKGSSINGFIPCGGLFTGVPGSQLPTTTSFTLPPKQSCDFGIIFDPTAAGPRADTLVFSASAGSSGPQNIPITGTGAGPNLVFTKGGLNGPGTVALGSALLQTATPSQPITLQNIGNDPAPFSYSLSYQSTLGASGCVPPATQPSSPNPFAVQNACANPVPAGVTCSLNATFTPTLLGSGQCAKLTITVMLPPNNTPTPLGSPVTLTGDGTGPFSINTDTGTQNIAAGSTATFQLSLISSDFHGTVTVDCPAQSSMPPMTTCAASSPGGTTRNPSTVTLNGSEIVPVTITVTTTAHTKSALLQSPGLHRSPGWPLYAASVAGLIFMAKSKKRRGKIASSLMLGLMFALVSCGGSGNTTSGGGGGSTSPACSAGSNTGTPCGSYSLNIAAVSDTGTQTVPIKLNVQ